MNPGPSQPRSFEPDALIVGAGIQGLCCALTLAGQGRKVLVLSAGADPRVSPALSQASTTVGESGRLLTLLEGRPLLGVAGTAFEHGVDQGGWLGSPQRPPTDWARRRRAAAGNAAAVERTTAWYAQTSARALALWRGWIGSHPEWFRDVSLHDGEITRYYDQPEAARAAVLAHAAHGALRREVPRPSGGVPGFVASGLVTVGISVNIRRLVANLLNSLEASGVRFQWNTPVTALHLQAGVLDSMVTTAGPIRARDVVLVPGAYAEPQLLQPLGVEVTGVAGRWLLLPRPSDWSGPLKLHLAARGGPRPAPALDLNFMAFEDAATRRPMVAVGGGYLHVGTPPFDHDPAQRDRVDHLLASAVENLWPDWWRACQAQAAITRSPALCVRAFTPDDRPAVRLFATAQAGRAVVHTGLGTGTAAMAPAIAEAIAAGLSDGFDHADWRLSPDRADAESVPPTQLRPCVSVSPVGGAGSGFIR